MVFDISFESLDRALQLELEWLIKSYVGAYNGVTREQIRERLALLLADG